jgi:hypothetical protein
MVPADPPPAWSPCSSNTRTELQARGVEVPWVPAAKPTTRSSTPSPAPRYVERGEPVDGLRPGVLSGMGSSMPGWMTRPVATIGSAMVGAAQAVPLGCASAGGLVGVSTSGRATGVGSAGVGPPGAAVTAAAACVAVPPVAACAAVTPGPPWTGTLAIRSGAPGLSQQA